MRKLLLLLFIFSAYELAAQKTVPHDVRTTFEYRDGQRSVLRPYGYYMTDTNPNGNTRMDYYRDINIFADGDTVNITFENTAAHGAIPGGMRVLKTPKGTTLNNKYSSITRDFYIPATNYSHGFVMIDDTIVGPKYADNYLTDTLLYLDRNYNRLLAIPFDQSAWHISDTTLFISQIVVRSSVWFMTGYYRPSDDLKTGVIMKSLNRGRTWDTVKTFPTTTYFLPEEPSLVKGSGDTLLWFCRSDFGTRTWISRSADGTTWSTPVIAFQGANQPRAIAIDSVIVCYGRPVGYPTTGQEIRYFPDTVRPQPYKDYTTYTNIGVSLDNGRTWNTAFVDKTRSESFGWPGLSSETGHFYRIGGDTIRFVWATGNEGLGDWDGYGDLNQATIFINRYQPGDIRFIGGGISANIPNYNTNINVDSLVLKDTANDKYAAIEVENNALNFTTNTAKYDFDNTVVLDNAIGVNVSTPEAGRIFDFTSIDGSEYIRGGDGNIEYYRGGGGNALRIYGGNGGNPNSSGQGLAELSLGGFNGSRVKTFEILPRARQSFAVGNGSDLAFTKSNYGLTTLNNVVYWDTANRVWFGNSSTLPTLTTTFNVQGTSSFSGLAAFGAVVTPGKAIHVGGTTDDHNSILIQPTTTTRAGFFAVSNQGGSHYFAADNSTGSQFSNGAYAMNMFTSGNVPMAFSTNGTNRILISGAGATTIRGALNLTGVAVSTNEIDTLGAFTTGGALVKVKNPYADGTFTPTLTGVANITSSTAYNCIYSKNDSTVTVSGKIEFTTTTGGGTLTRLGISIPFASNFTADDDCSGTAFDFNDLEGAVIISDATNDRIELTYHDDTAATHIMRFTCQYRIK